MNLKGEWNIEGNPKFWEPDRKSKLIESEAKAKSIWRAEDSHNSVWLQRKNRKVFLSNQTREAK